MYYVLTSERALRKKEFYKNKIKYKKITEALIFYIVE